MSPPRCSVRDLMGPLTQRRITDEGFLVAPGNLARAGNVQQYRASELGLDKLKGMDAGALVSLYRPVDEVFAPDAIASFQDKTLTLGHPPDGVTAENWSGVAIGDVREVKSGAGYMTADLIVRDAAAIKAIQSGKSQLSCGYSFDCDMTPGKTADGLEYHGVMRAIRGNHVAAVDSARGGAGCRVADDNKRKGSDMALTTIVLDGFTLELEGTQASIVKKLVGDAQAATSAAVTERDKATAQATAADAALKLATDAHTKAVADAASKLVEAEAKILKPEQITALVTELSAVARDAALIAPDLNPDGKTAHAVRVEALTAIVGSDDGAKKVATAILGGAELAKADEKIVKSVFDGVIAVHGAVIGGDPDREKRIADALVGDGKGGGKARAPSARELFIYRENHGGRSPGESAA